MGSSVLPTPPSPQYWLDRQWIHDHYTPLVNRHPNEWIAVHRGQVLASGPELATVEDTARTQCAAGEIVFQFIDDGSLIL